VRNLLTKKAETMEFFGMGTMEILVVLVVSLIAFGPGKLPQVARNLGKGMSAFRKITRELTEEMSKEFKEIEKQGKEVFKEEKTAVEEMSKELKEIKRQGKEAFKEEKAAEEEDPKKGKE